MRSCRGGKERGGKKKERGVNSHMHPLIDF